MLSRLNIYDDYVGAVIKCTELRRGVSDLNFARKSLHGKNLARVLENSSWSVDFPSCAVHCLTGETILMVAVGRVLRVCNSPIEDKNRRRRYRVGLQAKLRLLRHAEEGGILPVFSRFSGESSLRATDLRFNTTRPELCSH